VVANPVNDLIAVLGAVIGKEDELAAGCAPVTESERAGWDILPAGEALLRDAGGTPADDRAADEFYERTWARPSLTVHSIGAGDPLLHKTSVASEARASLSLRLAPGQDPDALFDELERRLRAALPSHAQLELDRWPPGQPAYMSPDDPVMHAAQRAIEQATGVAPVTMRSGGTIPIMAALIARGTPTILSGFGTSEDNIHSPNERIRLRNLAWGLASAREIYRELAGTLG
jgi:acetylornithine deacetylase/succinyl-diaminopimelate desuccinylase-like protein